MISKDKYMKVHGKSRGVSFALTLFIGPFGLLYTSGKWGAAMIALAILTIPTYVGPAIVWIISICLGDHLAHGHNERKSMDYDLKTTA